MNSFAPASAFFGGLLIGTSAALLLLVNGRIAGISGIVDGLLSPRLGDLNWRVAFIAGLVLAPLFYAGFGGVLPTVTIAAPPTILTLAGLLIGFGARLGSGCTSGHGVCGTFYVSAMGVFGRSEHASLAGGTAVVGAELLCCSARAVRSLHHRRT